MNLSPSADDEVGYRSSKTVCKEALMLTDDENIV